MYCPTRSKNYYFTLEDYEDTNLRKYKFEKIQNFGERFMLVFLTNVAFKLYFSYSEITEVMPDGQLCDVIESNEDIAHDSKVGRLVSEKNGQREIPRVPASSELQIFI